MESQFQFLVRVFHSLLDVALGTGLHIDNADLIKFTIYVNTMMKMNGKLYTIFQKPVKNNIFVIEIPSLKSKSNMALK